MGGRRPEFSVPLLTTAPQRWEARAAFPGREQGAAGPASAQTEGALSAFRCPACSDGLGRSLRTRRAPVWLPAPPPRPPPPRPQPPPSPVRSDPTGAACQSDGSPPPLGPGPGARRCRPGRAVPPLPPPWAPRLWKPPQGPPSLWKGRLAAWECLALGWRARGFQLRSASRQPAPLSPHPPPSPLSIMFVIFL